MRGETGSFAAAWWRFTADCVHAVAWGLLREDRGHVTWRRGRGLRDTSGGQAHAHLRGQHVSHTRGKPTRACAPQCWLAAAAPLWHLQLSGAALLDPGRGCAPVLVIVDCVVKHGSAVVDWLGLQAAGAARQRRVSGWVVGVGGDT